MKLKPVFLLLNIVLIIVIFLCFFSFFSLASFSGEGIFARLSAGFFISAFSCLMILAILVCANVFFIKYSRMFDFLIEENWQALALLFEQQMLEKGRFSRQGTSLFISVLVLLSDYKTLCRLFSKLKTEKPALYRLFAPDFIAASIAFGNIEEAEACIASALREAALFKPCERDWVKFYSAFIAFRRGKYQPVSEEFIDLALSSPEPVVYAVSGYFCARLIPARTFGVGVSESALSAASSAARKKILGSFSRKRWQDYCTKTRKKVRAAVIGKTIGLASEWIFDEEIQAKQQV